MKDQLSLKIHYGSTFIALALVTTELALNHFTEMHSKAITGLGVFYPEWQNRDTPVQV